MQTSDPSSSGSLIREYIDESIITQDERVGILPQAHDNDFGGHEEHKCGNVGPVETTSPDSDSRASDSSLDKLLSELRQEKIGLPLLPSTFNPIPLANDDDSNNRETPALFPRPPPVVDESSGVVYYLWCDYHQGYCEAGSFGFVSSEPGQFQTSCFMGVLEFAALEISALQQPTEFISETMDDE